MRTPCGIISLIPASGTVSLPSTIPLVRTRTISITVRLTFGAQIAADATVKLYYSPDGNNWDTEVLTSWGIAYTASATKQITRIIDVPEHGYLWVKITNESSADTISRVNVWYTIQSWDEIDANLREELMKKAQARQLQEETGQV
jgi:hypothetical protein